MQRLSEILKNLEQGKISVDNAEVKILRFLNVNNKLHIYFAAYLTGHDEETIEQMYNDWQR